MQQKYSDALEIGFDWLQDSLKSQYDWGGFEVRSHRQFILCLLLGLFRSADTSLPKQNKKWLSLLD